MQSSVRFEWQNDIEEDAQAMRDWRLRQRGDKNEESRNDRWRLKRFDIVCLGFLICLIMGAGYYQQNRYQKSTPSQLPSASVSTEIYGDDNTSLSMLPHTRETQFFRLTYPQRDAAVVEAMLPEFNRAFQEQRQLFNLEASELKRKLILDITSKETTLEWRIQLQAAVIVSSVIKEDVRLPSSLVLKKVFYDALSRYFLSNAEIFQVSNPEWHVVLIGLRHWLRDSYQYQNLSSIQSQNRLADISVSQPSLATLLFADEDWMYDNNRGQRTQQAQHFVAYVAETYGIEAVSELLQALSVHRSWASLIPALFDCSAEEFEADWILYWEAERIEE